MKQDDQDVLIHAIVKKNFARQVTYSVEEAVMSKIDQQKTAERHITPNRAIYSLFLMLSIVFECCLILLPLNSEASFYLANGSSELYIIQSIALLAILLQIDVLIQNRKRIASKVVIQ